MQARQAFEECKRAGDWRTLVKFKQSGIVQVEGMQAELKGLRGYRAGEQASQGDHQGAV
jgi:hypothetical protein